MNSTEIIVSDSESGIRIDKFISDKLDNCTRSYVQKLIESGNIFVNNKLIKSNYKLKEFDCICVNVPEPELVNIVSENIPLDIVYEDEYMLIVDLCI